MTPSPVLPRVRAERLLSAVRAGSSLPCVFAIEGGGRMLVKFRGAGAGVRALGLEIVVGALAETAGLTVPARAIVEISDDVPTDEHHEEIVELLRKSAGENLGFDFLPAARLYVPGTCEPPDAELASLIVAFDTFLMNVDRTEQNPNLLVTTRGLVCIDHGSVALFEHGPRDAALGTGAACAASHVLAKQATRLLEMGIKLGYTQVGTAFDRALAQVPGGWLPVAAARAVLDARVARWNEWLADAVVGRTR